MIYTPLTNKAIRIAYKAHEGVLDKSGIPYILHPVHLAEQMSDEYTTIAALLHDVVEDTDITLDDLRQEGFPAEVLEAIRLLTHGEGVPYMEYVAAIKENPIAKAVKLADLRHNMDQSRFAGSDDLLPTEDALEYYRKKYEPALALLLN